MKNVFNKSNKFYLTIFLILFASYNISNAQSLSDSIPETSDSIETSYTNSICQGGSNIVAAGCSVIAGQVVRGVPSIAFGASFDKMKTCVERFETRTPSAGTVQVDINDTCNQLGMLNPNVDKSRYAFNYDTPSSDVSLLGAANNLTKISDSFVSDTFDNTYYAAKSVENIPYVKTALAQTTSAQPLVGIGGWLRDTTYTTWVTVRNIAYLMLGLLSIVLGITLMSSNSFLDKNAKWRLSLEQALPKVIIAVILIQFSYSLGEIVLYIANNETFRGVISYVFNYDSARFAWMFISNIVILALISVILSVAVPGTQGYVVGFLLIALVVGLLILYRYFILWFLNFKAVLAIVLLTIASPVIIAMSLLPGEAGANQLKRYFATLVSLISQTFLYQLIKMGPVILIASYFLFSQAGPVSFQSTITMFIVPILTVIIYGYADAVVKSSNQFAKNLVGADPIGSESSGK